MRKLVDTHSHIYLDEFSKDLPDVVSRAVSNGVVKVLLPNINWNSLEKVTRLCDVYRDFCYPMIGLHPTELNDDFTEQLEAMHRILAEDCSENGEKKFIGVGEVGIDMYWDQSNLKGQTEAFHIQIEWALEFDLPIAVHSRSAFRELCSVLDQYRDSDIKGVFHCFSPEPDQAERLMEYKNFLFGVGGVLTYKNSTLPVVLRGIPLERIVLETDSPYLAPVPYRGKKNEPSYIVHVAKKIADIYNREIDDVARITTDNALTLFSGVR